jgi:pyruvate formate lyase activating enzyme
MRPPLGLVADIVPFSWVDGPGNRFVVFLQGCNLNCVACHNPHTIPLSTPTARVLGIPDVLDRVHPMRRFLSGVTVSGGEATMQTPFVAELFAAITSHPELAHLTRFIDTNGVAELEVWDRLMPVMDAAMVDLKAFDQDVHVALTGTTNDDVLSSIRHLARNGKLYEVRLLLVPGVNDSPDQLARTAEWLLGLDPDMRVKAIGFRPHGVRAAARHWTGPTEEQRAGYERVLSRAGVRELALV